MDRKPRVRVSTIILMLLFLAGLSLLLYPTAANRWNKIHAAQAVGAYEDFVGSLSTEEYERMWSEAHAYNEDLMRNPLPQQLQGEQLDRYMNTLNLGGSGVMGYIEIPFIDVEVPIYHGTDENVLQTAIGHIEWTSLPVGGINTHTVLSGHRGLPSARLFTDLDQLVVGDEFMIHVLDDILTYEIDQILIVLPNEVSSLRIVEGEDLCTLVTCTPYGINTHRLLLRGHRVDTDYSRFNVLRVRNEARVIDPNLVAPFMALPMLVVLLIVLLVSTSRGGRRTRAAVAAGKVLLDRVDAIKHAPVWRVEDEVDYLVKEEPKPEPPPEPEVHIDPDKKLKKGRPPIGVLLFGMPKEKKPKPPREKKLKEPKKPKEPRKPKEPKPPKEPRKPKEPKAPKTPKKPREPKKPKAPKTPAADGSVKSKPLTGLFTRKGKGNDQNVGGTDPGGTDQWTDR